MTALICPKGHDSTDSDFCSVCGAKMPAAADGGSNGPPASLTICPDCGTKREAAEVVFCELCGYNFTTGAHGELRPAAVEQKASANHAAPLAPVAAWQVIVTVDPGLRAAESPEAPTGVAPVTLVLHKESNLIGRLSERRGVFPDVALDTDDAVSHRHALLNIAPDGVLTLRDIGSSNGTRLNGTELAPTTDVPLKDGDEITLGHWTRLQVKTIP